MFIIYTIYIKFLLIVFFKML